MYLLKKILLLIIGIQTLVSFQLLAIKHWNLEEEFEKLSKNFTFSTAPKIETPYLTFYTSLHQKIKLFPQKTFQQRYLTLNTNTLKNTIRYNIESYSKKLLGIRYVWGATGPNKFDCSGFTQKVYSAVGLKIPRNSKAQARVGKYVTYENLKRGDMVFFSTNRAKKGIVTHVGIYLQDGKFIHASSGSKKVVITDFKKKKYYKQHFLWGRRIITSRQVKKLLTIAS